MIAIHANTSTNPTIRLRSSNRPRRVRAARGKSCSDSPMWVMPSPSAETLEPTSGTLRDRSPSLLTPPPIDSMPVPSLLTPSSSASRTPWLTRLLRGSSDTAATAGAITATRRWCRDPTRWFVISGRGLAEDAVDSATSIEPDDEAAAGACGLENETSIDPEAPGGSSAGADSRARFAARRALFDALPEAGSSGTPVDGFDTGSSTASGVASAGSPRPSGELGGSGSGGVDTINHDMEKKRATRFSATSRR